MPRGGYYNAAPEDPAYYEAIAGGTDAGIASGIFDDAVAGVAAPLLLRNKRKAEAQAAKDRQEMAMSLFDAAVAAGETEQTARLVALQYLKTGETSMAALLQGIRKGVGEDRLNTANIELKGTEGLENIATANKTNVDAGLAPGLAESKIGLEGAQGRAAIMGGEAAKTAAYAGLQDVFARKQGKDREQLFSEFQYFDKNGDGQIDREEAEKARMSKRQEVRKEMESINEEWDAYDAMPAEAKANTPAPTSKRIAPEDIATEADRRAEEYLNDLNEIRLTNNEFLGRIGKTPLGGGPAPDSTGGMFGGGADTQRAIDNLNDAIAKGAALTEEKIRSVVAKNFPNANVDEVIKRWKEGGGRSL